MHHFKTVYARIIRYNFSEDRYIHTYTTGIQPFIQKDGRMDGRTKLSVEAAWHLKIHNTYIVLISLIPDLSEGVG